MDDWTIFVPFYKNVSKINTDAFRSFLASIQQSNRVMTPSKISWKECKSLQEKFSTPLILLICLPLHELKSKSNAIITLLCNSDVSDSVYNGIRYILKELCKKTIKVKIVTAEHSGSKVHILWIALNSSSSSWMWRYQLM